MLSVNVLCKTRAARSRFTRILLHHIYPNLNHQQLLEAKEHLDRYFDLAVRIFLRLEREEAGMLDQPDKNS